MRTITVALIILCNVSGYSQIVLNNRSLPKANDSVLITPFLIPSTEVFKDTLKANDSLTIDRAIEKAIEKNNPNDLMKKISKKGYRNDTIRLSYYKDRYMPFVKKYIPYSPELPGAENFTSSNVVYLQKTKDNEVYRYYRNDETGFYELGFFSISSNGEYLSVNNPERGNPYCPFTYLSPNNDINIHYLTVGKMGETNVKTLSQMISEIDAYGSLTIIVSDSNQNEKTIHYDNFLRKTTLTYDTIKVSDILIFTQIKNFSYYVEGIVEPVINYTIARSRNNLDTLWWKFSPNLHWNDQIVLTFAEPLNIKAIANANSPVCVNSKIKLTANFIDGANYLWEGPEGFTSNERNPVINNAELKNSGWYKLKITKDSLTSVDSVWVEVVEFFENKILSTVDVLCPDSKSVQLEASFKEGQWVGNGIVNTTQGVFNPSIAGPGNHKISYIPAGNCANIADVIINVYEQPVADFTYIKNEREVKFENKSSKAITYLWDFGDGNKSTDINPVHNYGKSATYKVQLTASNEYCKHTVEKIILINTGIDESKQNTVHIYPNPTNTGVINLEFEQNNSYNIKIYDVFGRLVLNENINSNKHLINIDNLTPGSYVLRITGNNLNYSQIIIISQ